jgi:hypothetical protein
MLRLKAEAAEKRVKVYEEALRNEQEAIARAIAVQQDAEEKRMDDIDGDF